MGDRLPEPISQGLLTWFLPFINRSHKEGGKIKTEPRLKQAARRLVKSYVNTDFSDGSALLNLLTDTVNYLEFNNIKVKSQLNLESLQQSLVSQGGDFYYNRRIKKEITPFVNYVLNPNSDFRDNKTFKYFKRHILYAEKRTIFIPFFLSRNPIREILNPTFYYALKVISEDKFLKYRGISCKECNKRFLPKTLRNQSFCSNGCRYKFHNSVRGKSGEHTDYMKTWRQKRKIRV